jgi:hypothetical protein
MECREVVLEILREIDGIEKDDGVVLMTTDVKERTRKTLGEVGDEEKIDAATLGRLAHMISEIVKMADGIDEKRKTSVLGLAEKLVELSGISIEDSALCLHCTTCAKHHKDLQVCTQCPAVYCTGMCQMLHWKRHLDECIGT